MSITERWDTCRRYAMLMMERRGYHVEKDEDPYLVFHSSEKGKVIMWFYQFDKMNIEAIKEFSSCLEERKMNHGIIIYQNTITSTTKKVIENLYRFVIELFELKELQYDITLFKYYCHHEKLSASQTQEIKKKYGTSLPTLLRTDPVCRYFLFQRGDVIHIHRKNGTIMYRLVK